jgi:hypothetical protein
MALGTYAQLQASIADWLHKDNLTTVIPDFITLAETQLNADLDSRGQETRTSLTANTTTNLVALPTDMLEMRRLTITSTTPYRVLEYKSPEQLYADTVYITTTEEPVAFTVIGPNIELNCIPDAAYTLEIVYRQKLTALSVSNTTNWLLTGYPNTYLFGSLLQSAPWIQDDDRIVVWQKMYRDAVQMVNSIDWYSGSGLRVRAL